MTGNSIHMIIIVWTGFIAACDETQLVVMTVVVYCRGYFHCLREDVCYDNVLPCADAARDCTRRPGASEEWCAGNSATGQ